MADDDPTRRYAWDGNDVQFPSKNTNESPVSDRIREDTEKEKKEAKKETSEKGKKETKKEKPEKKDKKEEKAEKQKEKPEKEKKKSAQGQPAPADLVNAIEDVISDCIVPPLITRFVTEFPGAKGGKSAKKYVLDRNSKVHKEFKEFCISNLSGDDIESLDALTELLDDYKNDYDAFMNRFHEIWETYFKLGRNVFLEDHAFVPLKLVHDKYLGDEKKTEVLEKEEKAAKTEMLEKKKAAKTEMLEKEKKEAKKDKKETKPEKSEKKEKTKKEKPEKEKKKKSGHVQPPPQDLIRAINTVVFDSLLPTLESLFLERFPDAGKCMGDGRTPRDYLMDRNCDLHKEFKKFCSSQLCSDIEGLDALTELIDDDDTDDYVSFIKRFHDIWETYFKLRRVVHLDNKFYVPLEQCHDEYWDEKNKKPK